MGVDRSNVEPNECAHGGVVLVSPAADGNGRVARCLACGTPGPVRETFWGARRALEARVRGEAGHPDPQAPRPDAGNEQHPERDQRDLPAEHKTR